MFRKRVVISALVLVISLCFVGSGLAASSGNLKLGHTESAIDIISSPYMALTDTFKSTVEAQTNARFKIQVYPNKQLGDLQDLLTQCQKGVIDMTVGQNVSVIASIYPEAAILELPYAFVNTDLARAFLNGPYGRNLSDNIAENTGVRPLAWLPSAMRCFANNVREIKSPEDMKGLKIRVMPAPMHVEMVKALGAQPTPIAWAELYTSLQTGVVDGHEQAPYQIPMANLDEVSKYFTLDNHVLNVTGIFINEKFYQSLSEEDKAVFRLAARNAQLAFLGIVQAKEPADFETMRNKGMKITALTPEEQQKFKELAQPAVVKLFNSTLGEEVVSEFLEAIKEMELEFAKQ